MRKLGVVYCIALVSILIASNALGTTISVVRDASHGTFMDLLGPSPTVVSDPVSHTKVAGGLFKWDINAGANESDYVTVTENGNIKVLSFCIDLKEYVPTDNDSATYEYFVENRIAEAPRPHISNGSDPSEAYPMGADKAKAISILWAQHFGEARLGGTNADAFQLAIWEILFEPWANRSSWSVSMSQGAFYHESGAPAAATLANTWLTEVRNAYALYPGELADLVNERYLPHLVAWVAPYSGGGEEVDKSYQDQLVEKYYNTPLQPPPVPEPATVINLAWLAMLGGAGAFRRLRRGKC
jgi:hypothetical protein